MDYNYSSVMRNKKNHSPYTIPSLGSYDFLDDESSFFIITYWGKLCKLQNDGGFEFYN